MLNFKDLIYVKKLILSGKLLISKKDRKALTEEDVSKLSFINETSADKKIYWRLIKNVSLDEIKKLFIYLTFDLHELNIFLNNGYDIEKFIEEILMVYKDNYSEYIIKMIKLNYTIEQIKFLLENKMLYNTYHCHFDYYEIFDEYTNLGFDPSKKSVISCSTSFLNTIKKMYSISECYILTKIKYEKYRSEEKLLRIISYLHDKNFSVYEIYTLCYLNHDIDIDELKKDFYYGKSKNHILEQYILNSNYVV